MQHIRVGSFFSGLGAFEKALERLGIPHEIAFYCEIDKWASQSFSLIHNVPESLNLWDITKVDETKLPDFDLMTWGFPCQDISVAGKQAGIIEGETRSGLYYDGLRILKHKMPKYSIIENVKNLTSKKFRPIFHQILCDLEDAGYHSYYEVLNAKDYGIPQNRERIFIVSIRKDINQRFSFPAGFDNGLRLKDLLEDEVDEKYYISQEKTDKLIEQLKDKEISNTVRSSGRGSLDKHQWDLVCVGNINPSGHGTNGNVYAGDISPTITTSKGEGLKIAIPVLTPDRQEKRQNGRRFKDDGEPMFTLTGQDRHGVLMQVGMLDIKGNEQIRRVYSEDGLSPTLNCMEGENRQPKVLINEPTVFEERKDEGMRFFKNGVCGTLRTISDCGDKRVIYPNYRIRKLTPLECFRLMDFDDADWQVLVDNGISDSQLYKMAGNSIVVKVLEKIMENLFMGNAVSCTKQLALFG